MERLLVEKRGKKDQLVYLQGTDDGSLLTACANITTKFREAFEAYTPNGEKWVQSTGAGDIVRLDGNAIAASYLVISKDPLGPNTVTEIETVGRFAMPIEMAVGLSMSQRTLGQEFAVEVVSDEEVAPVPDIAIASISQAASVLTINTTLPHGLVPGKRIGVKDVTDSRLNYPALVVATIPSPTQITCTAGPGGNLPSVTAGPFTSGAIYFRSALGFAENGTSLLFENATVTNGAIYVRSESGDVLPSGTVTGNHSLTVGTTASVQAINAPYTYAFQPTSEFKLVLMADRLQWSDAGVDTTGAATNRSSRSQVVPDPSALYKFRVRATNNDALTVPTAQIVSVTKTGTTTATIVFDRPHGLTTTDVFVAYGVRDQANFANLAAATAVASVVNPTTITAVWGSAVTATSYGGYAAKVQGGNLMSALGQGAVVVQSATLTNGILTLVGNTNWAGLLVGDYTNAIGVRNAVDGATFGVDGAYRVRSVVTTTLELERIDGGVMPADFALTNCGGTVIKRTDMRISFVRVFDFERERVEIMSRPAGDQASAIPVAVQNAIPVTQSGTWNVGLNAGTNTIGGTFAQSNVFHNESTTNLAANATFTGASRDVGVAALAVHRYSAFNATVTANQAGTVRIEQSNDNTTWRRATADTAVAINTPVILSVPVCARYYRVIHVNGATATTELMINSSFTAA